MPFYPDEPVIRWNSASINKLLLWAAQLGMSDLCLCSGKPAWMRLNGEWKKATRRPISTDELIPVLEKITRNNSVSAVLLSGQT
ncbi:MAG: hypothetical protein IKL01_08855, partial [Mailhella sp.]|nr:hypothetical protein [Mailhella sp.]